MQPRPRSLVAIASRITIHWEPPSIPLAVGDPIQFKQVFLNLILNALQAIQSDGEVWIESKIAAEEIILTFRDSGPGIPADLLDKVFNPFFTTKLDETGLSLAITYRIIQSYHGKISVKTRRMMALNLC